MAVEFNNKRALLDALGCSEAGLSSREAQERRRRYGPNEITFHRSRSPLKMLVVEFTALFPLLLLASSALSFLAHHLSPDEGYGLIAMALLGVVVLNALVSFFQNYKVEKLLVSFLDYIPKQVVLLRNGEKALLDAKEAVPGDLLFIQEGDKIPADGVLISAEGLLLDESILTGESEPLSKVVLDDLITPACCVRSGASVISGHGTVLISRTGRSTSLGLVSQLAQGVEQDLTPMQKELQDFVHKITWLALGIGSLFFVLGFFIGNPFWTNLIFAIGIIVANVPEGLLPTVTLALTQSSVRMGRCNALVKQILSVETLGSTTVICTDKTGTLTRNRLHVERLFIDLTDIGAKDRHAFTHSPAARPLLEAMGLCNDVMVVENRKGHERFKGDPTETALVEFVDLHTRLESLRGRFQPLASCPFDSESKLMWSSYLTGDNKRHMVVKGAPEVIIERCNQHHHQGVVVALAPELRQQLLTQAHDYAAQGLRVLSLAYRLIEEGEEQPEELVFIGHVALVDPPRPEVAAAVAACKSAGIRIIVISGDKGETVSYIARQLGIVTTPKVIEGEQLANMDSEELIETLRGGEVVFARVAPEQKLDIVNALKEMGEVVAVTGDGVNDAPALKRADIGIAMGLRGTDVAKEASDIILLDDNFATIVKAVEEGRAVYDNIKKFITYILTSNIPEILPFIAYVLLPIPLPITVIQILAIDLITDVLPAIGLGNVPPEADIMQRPPRRRDERLVDMRTFMRSYGLIGPAEAALSFAVFFLVLDQGGWLWGVPLALDVPLHAQASGAFLATIIFCQIGNVMACRTNRQSVLPLLLHLNRWLLLGIVVELLFILLITYVTPLNHLFNTAPFPPWIWGVILLAPLVILALEEGRKYLSRRAVAPPAL